MINTAELIELAKFLKILRQCLIEKKGIYFVDHDMFILKNTYYVRIAVEKIIIKNKKMELEISNESFNTLKIYYNSINCLLDSIYYQKESVRQFIQRIDFILERIAKKHTAILTKAEGDLLYEDLVQYI